MLTLGFFSSSFSSCFRCRVRLSIWCFSCFLRYDCITINLPLRIAFAESHRFWVVMLSLSFVSRNLLISFLIYSVTSSYQATERRVWASKTSRKLSGPQHLKEDKQAGSGGRNWTIALQKWRITFQADSTHPAGTITIVLGQDSLKNCGASPLSQGWSFQGLDSKCFSESLQPSLKISVFPEEALLEQKV